jgi:hypothetical protein
MNEKKRCRLLLEMLKALISHLFSYSHMLQKLIERTCMHMPALSHEAHAARTPRTT